MTKTRAIVFFLFVAALQNSLPAQNKVRFGLSGGLTCSYAKTKQPNIHGELSPGFGLNLYFPLSIKLNDKFSLEPGLGYYFNRFTVKYKSSWVSSLQGHPFTALKICYSHAIENNNALFSSLGFALDYFPVKNTFTSTDSLNETVMIDNSVGKSNQYLCFEFGFRKTTAKNKIHQISLQYFYGLQEIANGSAYQFKNPEDLFKYTYSGHFATLQYTFWFGKKT